MTRTDTGEKRGLRRRALGTTPRFARCHDSNAGPPDPRRRARHPRRALESPGASSIGASSIGASSERCSGSEADRRAEPSQPREGPFPWGGGGLPFVLGAQTLSTCRHSTRGYSHLWGRLRMDASSPLPRGLSKSPSITPGVPGGPRPSRPAGRPAGPPATSPLCQLGSAHRVPCRNHRTLPGGRLLTPLNPGGLGSASRAMLLNTRNNARRITEEQRYSHVESSP